MELLDRIKRYYAFNKKEGRNLILAILIIGFIVGFDDGRQKGTWLLWLGNLISSIVIVTLAMLVRESAHRIVALSHGHKAEFEVWWNGLLIGVIFTFLSSGRLWVILPGSIILFIIQKLRLGRFRHGTNPWVIATSSVSGPIAVMGLALFFKLLTNVPFLGSNPLISKAVAICVAIAIWSMVPVPNTDGLNTYFGSRLLFIITFLGITSMGILILFQGIVVSLIGSLAIAILGWLLYYIFIESKLWFE